MIFHYAGKFDGDESKLPQREHHPNAVAFKEPEAKQFAKIANVGSTVLIFALLALVAFLSRNSILDFVNNNIFLFLFAFFAPVLTLLPHEFLHAVCFKEDVYMYNYLQKGMVFVVGTEDMSKRRFIFLSLLPNLIFGVVPYIVYLIKPELICLGIFSATCIGMGFGDYINVFNAIKQVPKNAKIYLCGFHSYWYSE